jgi:Uma2 family endonuclease
MASVTLPTSDPIPEPLELHNGDRMTQKEFHAIYEQMPEDFRAELIGGIVYVASPLKRRHGKNHYRLTFVFNLYESRTPGIEGSDNTTVILGEDDEPQPDLYLRILPECGGQSATSDNDYVLGAPELTAEVAHSSHAIDLHSKRDSYARNGVLEYIVVCVREGLVRWFDLQSGEEFTADAEGVLRSRIFPGLWLHGPALLARNYPQLTAALERGLATPEHAAFVAKLAGAGPKLPAS